VRTVLMLLGLCLAESVGRYVPVQLTRQDRTRERRDGMRERERERERERALPLREEADRAITRGRGSKRKIVAGQRDMYMLHVSHV
jgi:hypothetical protein